jgi:hypothetical protein
MNAEKTEAMIMEGGEVSQPISQEAYHYRTTGHRRSWKEKSKDKLPCALCGSVIS